MDRAEGKTAHVSTGHVVEVVEADGEGFELDLLAHHPSRVSQVREGGIHVEVASGWVLQTGSALGTSFGRQCAGCAIFPHA